MKTDKDLYEDIKEKLDFEPGIDSQNLTYSAYNGIVTINGTVRSYLEKQAVKHTIYNVAGVKGIADETVIESKSVLKPSDKDIVTAAIHILDWDATLAGSDIKVTSEKGVVILNGVVPWYFQKRNAEQAIRYLDGVVYINNLIVVKPVLAIGTTPEVKEKIKREFERHALIDARSISVEIVGAVITLKGHVQSWAEYKEASHIAWSIPGVSQVDNQIKISIDD